MHPSGELGRQGTVDETMPLDPRHVRKSIAHDQDVEVRLGAPWHVVSVTLIDDLDVRAGDRLI
jgi:hypothetical protein